MNLCEDFFRHFKAASSLFNSYSVNNIQPTILTIIYRGKNEFQLKVEKDQVLNFRSISSLPLHNIGTQRYCFDSELTWVYQQCFGGEVGTDFLNLAEICFYSLNNFGLPCL